MTRKTLLEEITSRLSGIYPGEEARAMAFVLFEEYLGLARHDVLLAQNENIGNTPEIEKAVGQLLTGRPLQYVTGKAWFCDMELIVNEGVLIPRPETEELVQWIIAEAGEKKGLRILDIGTGSGCIAISLAKALPQAIVSAVDISETALDTARKNAAANNADVDFRHLDILAQEPVKEFDIIVSNPPYVRESEKQDMRSNVLDHEPHTALFVSDDDPLLFYRRIALTAGGSLTAGGRLYFEINEAFGRETVEILTEAGFSDIELKKDIFDRDRMISAVWK